MSTAPAILPPVLPQIDIVRSMIVEKPKWFFQVGRDSLKWANLALPPSVSESYHLDSAITGSIKAVSIFSIPDTLKGLNELRYKVCAVLTEKEDGWALLTAIKELFIQACTTIEAACRAIKSGHYWNVYNVNLSRVGAVGSAVDLVPSGFGIYSNGSKLWETYMGSSTEPVNRSESQIKELSTHRTWWVLALNIAVFAIEALSLIALMVTVAAPLFLILSSTILVTEAAAFVYGKHIENIERRTIEVQLANLRP